jgi:hypothetical protein
MSEPDRFPFPTNPKHVRKARHDNRPQFLPEPRASVKEVRNFLYILLTHKSHTCAKDWTEWVLETRIGFNGNGHDLRNYTEQQLMNLCPITADALEIKSRTHKRGSFVPMQARADIGRVIAQYVADKKALEQKADDVQRNL